MVNILSGKGYLATACKTSADALEYLKSSKKFPYSLIISSYMMPKMKGDEILKNACNLAPDTQRLLIADTAELETMVNAINKANIHSCLTLPFEDEDFLILVNLGCEQYEMNLKQKNLKRVIHRQNKQLFQIASNFKKKSNLYRSIVEKKKKEIQVLEARLLSAGGSLKPDKPVGLNNILARKNTDFSSDSFVGEFSNLKDKIKQIMDTAVSEHDITLQTVSYAEAVDQSLTKSKYQHLVKEMMPAFYHLLEKEKVPGSATDSGSGSEPAQEIKEVTLDDHFILTLSKNKTKALIKIKTAEANQLTVTHVKQFLEKNRVVNGVAVENQIEKWLHNATPDDEPFIIALGREAKYPKNAEIRYHFPTDFLHAGKVNKDGSINFQDRGEIPHVKEDAFLAAKIFPEEGACGMNVLGQEILVDDPVDLAFSSGSGTRISEDGVRIYAETAGQPHLDAMGNISVCPEFQIQGDLGFETGDVNFEGNVVVNGSVKQGFKVTCASLTANEIQGAQIDVEGDLNVSNGIVDTELVKVKGSVQAKFIHNSKINAFGDLIIQKEIIDSKIYLSGACVNKTGSIINSEISAKMGINAGAIGNKSSKPSRLTVGVDEHSNLLVARIDSSSDKNNNAANELIAELKELEKEDQSLHGVISQQAFVQDRSQLELKDIEKKMGDLKASGNMAAFQKVAKTVKEIKKNAEEAEEKINQGFERQDEIALEISQKKGRIKEFEDLNKDLQDKKKRLLEFSNRTKPLPEVKVGKKIESGTKIFALNSSLTLYNSSSRCRIREFSRNTDGAGGIEFFEMEIGNY